MAVAIYCYLIEDILTKVLQECSLSSPLPNIYFFLKHHILIGCHGNRNTEFLKQYKKKTHLLRSDMEDKAETLQNYS